MGEIVKNKFVFILLILIGSMPLLDVIYPAKLEGVSRTVPVIIKLLLVIFLLKYFIEHQKKWWFSNSIGKVITVFILIHLAYLLVSSHDYIKDLYKFSKVLVWYYGFFFFMDLGYRNYLSPKSINNFFTVVIVLIFILVFFGVTNEGLFKSNRDYGASNFAYYLLFVLPFIFMSKKVPYRLAIFAIASVGVAISFKRGTMLMYVIMIIYLFFFSNLKEIAGKRFSKYFRVFIIAVIALVLYQVVFTNLDNYTHKFRDISEYDGTNINSLGSGRGLLYTIPLDRWLNSNFFNFLFGYGFNSTPSSYVLSGIFKKGFYAHSDVVMLIHDYGLVGLSILLSLFMRLFRLAKKSMLEINKTPLILIFIALFIKSLFSGFINYEYSIYAFGILGLIMGRTRRAYIEDKFYEQQQLNDKNI